MTDSEKYIELLKTLAELIVQKNIYINTRDFQIESLTRKLEIAEKQIAELRKEK